MKGKGGRENGPDGGGVVAHEALVVELVGEVGLDHRLPQDVREVDGQPEPCGGFVFGLGVSQSNAAEDRRIKKHCACPKLRPLGPPSPNEDDPKKPRIRTEDERGHVSEVAGLEEELGRLLHGEVRLGPLLQVLHQRRVQPPGGKCVREGGGGVGL